jgi:molybdopterin-binding protein
MLEGRSFKRQFRFLTGADRFEVTVVMATPSSGHGKGRHPFVLSFCVGYAMKISARNVLKGKVKSVTPGAVNSEVVVELPGGQEIVAVITKDSIDKLKVQVGKEVYAVVKASSVMIAVD